MTVEYISPAWSQQYGVPFYFIESVHTNLSAKFRIQKWYYLCTPATTRQFNY